MSYIVYKHTSPSNKIYIGITSQPNPKRRWRGGCGYKSNEYFKKAIDKYGWNNFSHEILYQGLTKEDAEQKEIELISFYKSTNPLFGYNLDNGGNSNGKHSESTKKKIGDANRGKTVWIKGKHRTEETKKKISESKMGSHLSDETKCKISEANKGKKPSIETVQKRALSNTGKKRTPEQCKKISDSLKGRTFSHSEETKKKISKTMGTPVICVETGVEYYGLRDAERKTGIKSCSISRCLNGTLKTTGGFHWKLADV